MFLCPLSGPNGKTEEYRGTKEVHSIGTIARQASREARIYSSGEEGSEVNRNPRRGELNCVGDSG